MSRHHETLVRVILGIRKRVSIVDGVCVFLNHETRSAKPTTSLA